MVLQLRRVGLCVCVLPESQRQSVFFIGSKFRAASFRPALIGNACKACHTRYNAHLFWCLVCIKEQREVVDVLLSQTIRRDEALQSKQTRKQCAFSYRFFSCGFTMPSLLPSHPTLPPLTTRGRLLKRATLSELSPVTRIFFSF